MERMTQKNISIGEGIKTMRIAFAWSQEEFAEHIDISCRALQRIESGESLPAVETLSRIGETMSESFMNVRDSNGTGNDKNDFSYPQFRRMIMGMMLCAEEMDLAIGVGLAKAERILRENC